MYVYEYMDKTGQSHESIQVRLIDTNMESAEKRALEIAGTEKRNKVLTETIIEKDD